MAIEKIEIEVMKQDWPGYFKVTVGNRVADKLCWDELLGLVASLTMPKPGCCQQWLKPCSEVQADEAVIVPMQEPTP